MTQQAKWFMTNGEELWRSWVADFAEIQRRSVVKRCRKDTTCVLGCKIPEGSSYFRLDMLAGGGCGTSSIAVGLCTDHLEKMAGGNTEQWVADLSAESFFSAVNKQ
jgi:hypothetical protein